jgi:hypothetical protein
VSISSGSLIVPLAAGTPRPIAWVLSASGQRKRADLE